MDEYSRDIGALKRIVKYCDRIQGAKERFGPSFDVFKGDYEYQSSCAMYILQIGESANRLSSAVKDKYSDIPWRDIIGMRNIFAHDYENIDVVKIWETLWDDVRVIWEKCQAILLELDPNYAAEPDDDDGLLVDEDDEQELEQ